MYHNENATVKYKVMVLSILSIGVLTLSTAMAAIPSARERALAVRALGEQGDDAAVAPLVEALGDTNVFVRKAAVQALQRLAENNPDTPVIAALMRGLDKENPYVRAGVAETLGILKAEASAERLIALLVDEDPEAQHVAACALGRLNAHQAVSALTALAGDSDAAPFARMGAVWALGELGDKRAVAQLLAVVQDARRGEWNYTSVGVYAVEALGKINDPESIPVLEAAREIDDRHLREQLTRTLEQMRSGPDAPFFDTQELFQGRRFPSVVVAMDGTVLAFRANRDTSPIQVRRSVDGGATWSDIIQVGEETVHLGAAIVDEKSGDVLVFDAGNTMYRSKDRGLTWQQEDVEIHPDGFGGVGGTHGADSGITLRYGARAGRLLQPARVYPPGMDNALPWRPYIYNAAIYSDDGGRTWQTSKPFPVLGTGEGALAELSDGRIYYNSREHMTRGNRYIAWSEDGGETWLGPQRCAYLPDGMRGSAYGCMGGLTRLPVEDGDILVYSNLDSEGGEGGSGRQRITVWASSDGGETWPVKRLVFDGPSAYSSLAAGRPGTPSEGMVYLLYEGGPEGQYAAIHIARFNLAWILNE